MSSKIELVSKEKGRLVHWLVCKGNCVRHKQPVALLEHAKEGYKILQSPYRGVVHSLLVGNRQSFFAEEPLASLEMPNPTQQTDFETHETGSGPVGDSMKKLFLVLDLDLTLLHATRLQDAKDATAANRSQMFDLSFAQAGMPKHFIKFRPFVASFLQGLQPFFEFAVYTLGNEEYAAQCVAALDPTNQFFKGRVASRKHAAAGWKTVEHLFHSDKHSAVVVDDTTGVWEDRENVLRIQRYRFWPNEDDINTSASNRDGDDEIIPPERLARCDCLDFDALKRTDRDNVLLAFKSFLKALHVAYFLLRQLNREADVRRIAKVMRHGVLRGTRLFFVECFPANKNPSDQKIWKLAEAHGASCVRAFSSSVTHIVCGDHVREDVARAYAGHKVSQDWVYDSVVHFKKANETRFAFGRGDTEYFAETESVVHYSDILRKFFLHDSLPV